METDSRETPQADFDALDISEELGFWEVSVSSVLFSYSRYSLSVQYYIKQDLTNKQKRCHNNTVQTETFLLILFLSIAFVYVVCQEHT